MSFNEDLLHIRTYQKRAPVNITRLIDSFDVQLKGAHFTDKKTSGKICYQESNNTYVIYINVKHSMQRKRFTAAHELAHYLLHREEILNVGSITENQLYRNDILSDELEREANKFAAEILMPMHLIRSHNTPPKAPQVLADIFRVSLPAMRIRLGLEPY